LQNVAEILAEKHHFYLGPAEKLSLAGGIPTPLKNHGVRQLR